jgi:hypothetical protein
LVFGEDTNRNLNYDLMIKFFRYTRKDLMERGKTGKTGKTGKY